jgi:hypothetical protein
LASPEVRVIGVSQSGNRVEIELRFRSGKVCSAIEPGDFLGTYCSHWWQRLREHLGEVTDRTPPPMTLTVHGVIEPGVLVEGDDAARTPQQTATFCYRHRLSDECDAR